VYTRLALCAILILAVVPFSLAARVTDTTSAAAKCEKGRKALERGELDAAKGYFAAASSLGMSDDSLYYFMSSMYLVKGEYDTALAFNFGMTPRDHDVIVRQLLQRSSIYTGLGWTKEAEEISDSLMRYAEYRRRFMVPEVFGNAGLDFERQRKKDQPSFPYLGPFTDTTFFGPGYGGNLHLHWDVPLGREFAIGADLFGSAASMYYRPATSADSMNISWGGGIGLEHKRSGVSLDYSLYRTIDYTRSYSTQNSIGISRTEKGKEWISLLSVGYGIELLNGLVTKDQTFWLTGYLDQATVTGKGFSALVNLSGYLASPVIGDEDFRVMYVENIAVRPVRHDSVDVVSQTPTSHPIPINPFVFFKGYTDNSLLLPSSRLFGISETSRYSRRYLSLAPQVTYRHPLPFEMSLCLGAGVSCDYYLEHYRWATVNIDKSAIDTTFFNHQVSGPPYYLAFDKADGRYYWVEALDNIGTGEEYGGPVEVSSYEKRRVDADCSLSLSVRRAVWKLGAISIGAAMMKNYSTLRKERFLWWQVSGVDAPFSIPSWSYGLSLNWNFVFSAN